MKLLQLVGLDRYASPITKLTAIQRDQVIAVPDDKADYMLSQFERSYDVDRPHWQEVTEGTPINYSFVEGVAATPVAATAEVIGDLVIEPEGEAAAPVVEPVAEEVVAEVVVEDPAAAEAAIEAAKPATQRVKRTQ